jgi:hypothetical protein
MGRRSNRYGFYLIAVRGRTYAAEQSLLEWTAAWPLLPLDDAGYQQWLGLTCPNGTRGWLSLADLPATPAVVSVVDARNGDQTE